MSAISYQCSVCPNCHDDHNHTEQECIDRSILGAGVRYESKAYWPKGTISGSADDTSTDSHRDIETARAVCRLLFANGFGGYGQIFPLKTEVTALPSPAAKEPQ